MKSKPKKLTQKIKKLQKRCQTLESKLIQSHHDVVTLDYTNFQLEKETTVLQNRLREYEETYFQNANDAFDKYLHDIITRYKKEKDSEFYESTIGLLLSYVQALKSYGDGDTQAIIQKIEHYKNEAFESKKELSELKRTKMKMLKKFNKAGQKLSTFKQQVRKI